MHQYLIVTISEQRCPMPHKSYDKHLFVLYLIDHYQQNATADQIRKHTKCSWITTVRQIKELRERFDVDIGSVRGPRGHYFIRNWGVFDREAIVRRFTRLFKTKQAVGTS